jgi:hypothetical protein
MALPDTTELAVPPGAPPEKNFGGIPAVPTGLPSVDQATLLYMKQRKDLADQQNKIISDLEARQNNPQDVLAAMSRGFLAPTRGGGFGESFGSAVGEMSKVQEEQRKRGAELASMRMALGTQQLAGTREDIELSREANAQAMLRKALSGEATTSAGGAAGTNAAGSTSLQSVFNRLDQDTKNLVLSMKSADATKFLIDLAKDDMKRPDAQKMVEYYISQMSPEAQIVARAFSANTALFGDPSVRAKTIVDIKTARDKGIIDRNGANELINLLGMGQQPTKGTAPVTAPVGAPVGTGAAPVSTTAAPVNAQPQGNLGAMQGSSGISPEIDRDILKQRAIAKEKEAEPARAAIIASDFSTTSKVDRMLTELEGIVGNEKNDKIWGLMQKQGITSALWSAANAEEGGTKPLFGTISAPVSNIIKNLQLNDSERAALTRATQITGDLFLMNAKTNKGLLGSQPSNNDAKLLQAPMGSPDDTKAAFKYWVEMNKIVNAERRDVYSAFREHDRKGGPLSSFFEPGGVYERISKDYSDHYATGVSKFSPALNTAARPAAPRPNVFGRIGQQVIRAVTP